MRPPSPLPRLVAGVVLALATRLPADNIRGTVKAVVALPLGDVSPQTTELQPQEFVLVTLPSDVVFLEGLELELTLGTDARQRYNEFAIVIYGSLDSLPTPGFRALTGTQVFLRTLGPLGRLFFLAGLSDSFHVREDPAQGISTTPRPVPPEDYPILVGVVAVGKTAPDPVQGLVFYLTCRSILREAGLLVLRILPPAGDHTYEVLLDDVPVSPAGQTGPWEAELELHTGLHTVRVTSSTLRTEERTFTVDAARTRTVDVELAESLATLTIEAPRGVAVYLDGRKLDLPQESRIRLSTGEHAVRYTLGDYTTIRSFTVAAGRSYTVYLEMVIEVKER